MVYPKSLFSNIKNIPFFYSNFVSTIDGKVQVRGESAKLYWPIGSELDFDTLLWLRANADVLIHGKNTALGFQTLKTLAKKEFKEKREILGKKNDLIYMVLSNHPTNKLLQALRDPPKSIQSMLVTNIQPHNSQTHGLKQVKIVKVGNNSIDLVDLKNYFIKNNLKKILIEGGPTIMASFLKENLIDEMFVTIAPKIFGNESNSTISMIEGHLFSPDKIPKFRIVSVKNIKNELYLRYRRSK